MAEHATKDTGVWVTYQGGVYDVTNWVCRLRSNSNYVQQLLCDQACMHDNIRGATTQLYCLSYLCIIMHIRNMNSNASVAMVTLIMFSVAIIRNPMACSIRTQGAVDISAVIVS